MLLRKKPATVRLGDQNLRTIDDGAFPVDYKIKNMTSHPLYDSRTKKHDIALIELHRNVSFNISTRPACLNQIGINRGKVIAVSMIIIFFSNFTGLLLQDWLGAKFYIWRNNGWASKSSLRSRIGQGLWINIRRRRQNYF